jgi:hypothetical protein
MRQLSKQSIIVAALTAAVVALAMAPTISHAYGLSGAGGRLGYSSPDDRDGTAQVGVHAEFEQTGTRVHLQPNVLYWKADGTRDLAPNMDVYYHFEREGKVSPYLGGGLGVNFIRNERLDRSSTDLGMNVIGGLRFPGAANNYFVESRFTASDINQIAVLGGITFHSR